MNEDIAAWLRNTPPFPFARRSIERLSTLADAIVVSQTPHEALVREWQEHSIDRFVRAIAGQELGTKTEHIAMAAGEKYPDERILMIGDAPGDYRSAMDNNALFFPVVPGHENNSWKLFFEESLDRFLAGTFRGEYQVQLISSSGNRCLKDLHGKKTQRDILRSRGPERVLTRMTCRWH